MQKSYFFLPNSYYYVPSHTKHAPNNLSKRQYLMPPFSYISCSFCLKQSAPTASYIICGAKWKIKMCDFFFKKHEKNANKVHMKAFPLFHGLSLILTFFKICHLISFYEKIKINSTNFYSVLLCVTNFKCKNPALPVPFSLSG